MKKSESILSSVLWINTNNAYNKQKEKVWKMTIKQYSGNKNPFVFVLFSELSRSQAEPIIELLEQKHKLSYGSSFGKREEQLTDKASAVVLIIEQASISQLEPAVMAIVKKDKEIIPVFLDDVTMSPGMSMLLGTKQIIFRSNYASEESFYDAIASSPVLNQLSVTASQKDSAKRILYGSIAAAIAVGVFFLWGIRGGMFGRAIREDSSLGKLGLSGSPDAITEVYVYGEEMTDVYEETGSLPVSMMKENGRPGLYLPEADREVGYGEISSAEDFSQLQNLEELSLAGNMIEDLSPLWKLRKLKKLDLSNNRGKVSLEGIGALTLLEELNLSGCEIESGLEELSRMKSLKRVGISDQYRSALSDAAFEIVSSDISVSTFAELKEALADESIFTVCLDSSSLHIPETEHLEIRRHVSCISEGQTASIRNDGEVSVSGTWTMGSANITNNGTIVIDEGGSYSGGMRETKNYGLFQIRDGGELILDHGDSFFQNSGRFENNGIVKLSGSGQFFWNGGSILNDGSIVIDEAVRNRFSADISAIEGSGKVTYASASSSDNNGSLFDSASIDDYGMTPQEREYFEEIDYPDYIPNTQIHLYPVVDAKTIEAKGSPRESHFYIARSMTMEEKPTWADAGMLQLVVGPNAVLTLNGDNWDRGSLAITVMPGGTLIVNGNVVFEIAANHGEMIINGELIGDYFDEWGTMGGRLANNGVLTVNGTCRLNQIWTFCNGEEHGRIETAERYDYSNMEPPFLFTEGLKGFNQFAVNRSND